MGQKLQNFFEIYFKELYFPKIQVTDVVEIIIIAFLVYQLMVWIKHTKAWMLLRGIIVLLVLITTGSSGRKRSPCDEAILCSQGKRGSPSCEGLLRLKLFSVRRTVWNLLLLSA